MMACNGSETIIEGYLEYSEYVGNTSTNGGLVKKYVILRKSQTSGLKDDPSIYLCIYEKRGGYEQIVREINAAALTGIEMGKLFVKNQKYYYVALILKDKTVILQHKSGENDTSQTSVIQDWNILMRRLLKHEESYIVEICQKGSRNNKKVTVHIFDNAMGISSNDPAAQLMKWKSQDIRSSTIINHGQALELCVRCEDNKDQGKYVIKGQKDKLRKIQTKIDSWKSQRGSESPPLMDGRAPKPLPDIIHNKSDKDVIHIVQPDIDGLSDSVRPPIPPKSPRLDRKPNLNTGEHSRKPYEECLLKDMSSEMKLQQKLPPCRIPLPILDLNTKVPPLPVKIKTPPTPTTPTENLGHTKDVESADKKLHVNNLNHRDDEEDDDDDDDYNDPYEYLQNPTPSPSTEKKKPVYPNNPIDCRPDPDYWEVRHHNNLRQIQEGKNYINVKKDSQNVDPNTVPPRNDPYVNVSRDEKQYVNPPKVHIGIPDQSVLKSEPGKPPLPERVLRPPLPPRVKIPDNVTETIERLRQDGVKIDNKYDLSVSDWRELTQRLDMDSSPGGKDWRDIADYLGMTMEDIHMITHSRKYNLRPVDIVLHHWEVMRNPPSKCNKNALRKLLKNIGRHDLLAFVN